jgi:tRNA uridine 5-carbamoylmethylation protein Kti12
MTVYTTLHNVMQHYTTLYKAIRYYTMLIIQDYTTFYKTFKNSLIIHEENTKKNHKRVVSLYVDKDFPSFT